MDSIKNPREVAKRNSMLALTFVGIASLANAWKHRAQFEDFTWWVFAVAGFGVTGICFAHAYVGAKIGKHKADLIFIIPLIAVLIFGTHYLIRYIDNI